MNRILYFLFIPLFFIGCKKDDSGSGNNTGTTKSASFSVTGSNFYLDQNITFTADDQSGQNGEYNWSFGDGATLQGNAIAKHIYTTAGAMSVKLQFGQASSAKNIRLFNGNLSYQVQNNSGFDLSSVEFFTNETGTSRDNVINLSKLSGNSKTDTLFARVTNPDLGDDHLLYIVGFINNVYFQVNIRNYLNVYNHVILPIDAQTQVIFTDKHGDIVPDKLGNYISYE